MPLLMLALTYLAAAFACFGAALALVVDGTGLAPRSPSYMHRAPAYLHAARGTRATPAWECDGAALIGEVLPPEDVAAAIVIALLPPADEARIEALAEYARLIACRDRAIASRHRARAAAYQRRADAALQAAI